MDEFPGGICVDCHRTKVSGQSAEQDYQNIMQGFSNPERVLRVQEIRKGNAAGPIKSKKSYKRKPKNQKESDNL